MRCSGWPGSVNQNVEDMSEFVPVLLAQGKKRELDIEDPRWQTEEGKQLMTAGYRKEMESLVEDTNARVLVSLEKSRLLRSSVPDRILEPPPVFTFRTKDAGTREVKCRCTGPKTLTFRTWCEIAKLRAPRCLRVDRLLSFCVDNRETYKQLFCWPRGRKGQRDPST